MQYAGGILLPPVQKLVATIIYAPIWGINVNESPQVHQKRESPFGGSLFLVDAEEIRKL
jgi:hypothetical protein